MSYSKNKVNALDVGAVVLFGLYINSRLNGDKDDSLVRTLAGLGLGGLGAAKGPETIETVKKLFVDSKYDSFRDGATYAAVGGITGVFLKDIISESLGNYKNKDEAVRNGF